MERERERERVRVSGKRVGGERDRERWREVERERWSERKRERRREKALQHTRVTMRNDAPALYDSQS